MKTVTDRRNLVVVLAVLLVSAFALAGTASAHRASGKAKPAGEQGTGAIHSLPSFTDQGESEPSFCGGECEEESRFAPLALEDFQSSVADVIEVEFKAVFAEHKVQISAHELASRCQILWFKGHSPLFPVFGASVTGVELDDAGNAEVAFIAGPSCAPGEVLISAHLEEAPYTTVTTAFTILAPRDTTPGVEVKGATDKPQQVEDDFDSSLFTIVQVEFPSVYAEQEVEIAAEQLFSRCLVEPKLIWITGSGAAPGFALGESVPLKLDNNGGAFAIIDAEESCASGTSEIEASLVKAPYTTYTTTLEIESPHETA